MASEQIHLICHEGNTIDRVDNSFPGCTVAPARKSETMSTPNLGCLCETVAWFVIRNGFQSAMDQGCSGIENLYRVDFFGLRTN